MAEQLDLLPSVAVFPDGFKYEREVISAKAEREVLAMIRDLPFQAFEFHGHVGNRRTLSFGFGYDFDRERLATADNIPAFLLPLRDVAAAFATLPPEAFQQVLVTEYARNAGIGWHRDKAVFGEIVGISLLSSCQFRLRRRQGKTWQRATVEAAPRSGYLLAGAARMEWEHSISPVDALRYSITFRTLAPGSTCLTKVTR
jgi:alkylated DNA repair dioxygenase AlkB